MPIRPPMLDDRRFDDLVEELVRRIPAHTPEWTNPQPGDPGRTLIELFAWLGDTILYRANRIPERQRLAFLALLGQQLRPAAAATGFVTLHHAADGLPAEHLRPAAVVDGPVPFETLEPITVMPVRALAFQRRVPTASETEALAAIVADLKEIYALQGIFPDAEYITSPLFADGPEADAWRPGQSVDGSVWLALVAARPEDVGGARDALTGKDGTEPILNVAVVPALEPLDPLEPRLSERHEIGVDWSVTTDRAAGQPPYLRVEPLDGSDSTAGLTRTGVVRLRLPRGEKVGAPSNEVTVDDVSAGTGDAPPRLDDPELAARVVTWLRMRPRGGDASVALSWVGINTVTVEQRRTVRSVVVGISDGGGDQSFALPGTGVEPASFELEVAEPGARFERWRQVRDVGACGRDDAVFELDPEAGTVRFGDGVTGRVPLAGARVRAATVRFGGGIAGNLAAGTLAQIAARRLDGSTSSTPLTVEQPLPTTGGEDGETLARAERRIPAFLAHRDRAVTATDYAELARSTPGARVGRVEVLPRFKPQTRIGGIPGVVSVLVLPAAVASTPPNPRADRPFLEAVHARLEARRPLGVELYTIGCEYVPIGLAVGYDLRPGHDPNRVALDVKAALSRWLWPLEPGGPQELGWPLGKTVDARELEVVVARVVGVASLRGLELFRVHERAPAEVSTAGLPPREWQRVAAGTVELEDWQLPELLAVEVATGDVPELGAELGSVGGATADGSTVVAIPVVPEVC